MSDDRQLPLPNQSASATRRILAIVDEEPYLADFEVLDRIDAKDLDPRIAQIAFEVLTDVGVLSRGGPVIRRTQFEAVERANGDLLDRLDRLASIGAGARLA